MPQQIIIAQHLKDEFKNVPPKIRDWFNSEQITDRIINLNKELGLGSKIEPGPKFKSASEKAAVIPFLLLRLEVKDLDPRNFTQELSSQLSVDYETAKSISREIQKQILEPISSTLFRLGIDTNLIAVGGLSLSEIKPKIPEEIETIPPIEKIETIPPAKLPPGGPLQSIEIEATKPTAPPIADTKTRLPDFEAVMPSESMSTDKPFIIHQETGAQPVAEKKKSTMPAIGWFKKERPKAPESPIKVQLETFGPKIEERKEPITAKTETPTQRIVHYREVETPTPFGKPGTQPPKESPAPLGRPLRLGDEARGSLNEIERQPSKIEAPAVKSEPPKSSISGKPEQPAKPIEPKVIDLESFFEVTEKKENEKNEVGLEGNTINLKNNNKE